MPQQPFQDERSGDSSEWGYWNEDQWEAFFQEQDEEIDRCMKEIWRWWDEVGSKEVQELGQWEVEGGDEEMWEDEGDEEGWLDEEELMDWDDPFEEIPAWRAAYTFGMTSSDFIEKVSWEEVNDVVGDDFERLADNCFMIAAHIAGGHEIGYEDEMICGNIAKCKRAVICTDHCIESLLNLSRYYTDAWKLLVQARIVRSFIGRRIADLRKNVWW